MVSVKFYGVQGGFTKTALLGGNSQSAGQSPRTPSESATASFDSLMDVKSAFALLLTKVTKPDKNILNKDVRILEEV